MTLWHLCDFAKRKKIKLYVSLVDFSTTYDSIPCQKLFPILRHLGCGAVIILVIAATYAVTHSVIGTSLVTATVGVKQGSPTSVILFIIFNEDLIKLIKESCGVDG